MNRCMPTTRASSMSAGLSGALHSPNALLLDQAAQVGLVGGSGRKTTFWNSRKLFSLLARAR